ncbi:MAG TPA: nitroreductase/quinone reductase family protein [Acidimicrobiales bacterium]|nr:nitroreductase/quinone reductase family protein [Acidimicrobiales bacterium]
MVRTLLRQINQAMTPLLRRGLGAPLPVGMGVVLLETTGRKSGRRREVPLLALRTPRSVVVATGRDRSDWLANVDDEPDVAVWLGGERRKATAHVRHGPVDLVTLELAPWIRTRPARGGAGPRRPR